MGLSVARQLAAKGANVIIIARSQQKLDAALAEIKVSDGHSPWVWPRKLTLLFPAPGCRQISIPALPRHFCRCV